MFRKLSIISFMVVLIVALYVGAMAQGRGPRGGMNGIHQGQISIVTLKGMVTKVQITLGQGNPYLILAQDSGGNVNVVLGPYRILVDKKVDIKEGAKVSIQAFRSLRIKDTYVAAQIKDLTTGATFDLRYANGMPLWAGQGFGRNGAAGCAGTGQPQLDLADKTSVDGIVQSINMGLHQGFPNFTMAPADGKTVTIVASPFHILQDSNFKIAINDKMSVLAYPSLQHEGAYVAAELKNLTNGTVLTLRDVQGFPVGNSDGRSCGQCGACRHPF